MRGNAGYDLMADLRGVISTMVADGQDRLASPLQKLQRQQAIAVGVSVTGAAFVTVLMLIAFALLVHYAGTQNNMRRTLQTEHDIALAADKAKSRFLATASHDLRQPLHAGRCSSARCDAAYPTRKRPARCRNRPPAELMQMMFNSLLDVSSTPAWWFPMVRIFPLQTVLDRLV